MIKATGGTREWEGRGGGKAGGCQKASGASGALQVTVGMRPGGVEGGLYSKNRAEGLEVGRGSQWRGEIKKEVNSAQLAAVPCEP